MAEYFLPTSKSNHAASESQSHPSSKRQPQRNLENVSVNVWKKCLVDGLEGVEALDAKLSIWPALRTSVVAQEGFKYIHKQHMCAMVSFYYTIF